MIASMKDLEALNKDMLSIRVCSRNFSIFGVVKQFFLERGLRKYLMSNISEKSQ